MKIYQLVLTTAAIAVSFGANNAKAGCEVCGCKPALIQQTVMVPQTTYETQKVQAVEYRWEDRQKTVTYYRCVPETKAVTKEITVPVVEQRKKTVQYTAYKPVWRTESREYAVTVPVWKDVQRTYTAYQTHREKRQAKRYVCRSVPVQEKRQVYRDKGQWVTEQFDANCCDPCGACCTQKITRNVWKPNVVTENVEVTVYKPKVEEVPYEYTCTVLKPVQKTQTVKVCEYRSENRTQEIQICDYEPVEQSREVHYAVCIPQKKSVTYNVTTYKQVPEQRVHTYRVCVPHTVEKTVQIRVCNMVPKTVNVPACGGYCCCH